MPTCAKCGKEFDAEKVDGKRHGWPIPNGVAPDGASLWKLLLCADATPADVAAYHAAHKVLKDRATGTSSKGFPGTPQR